MRKAPISQRVEMTVSKWIDVGEDTIITLAIVPCALVVLVVLLPMVCLGAIVTAFGTLLQKGSHTK